MFYNYNFTYICYNEYNLFCWCRGGGGVRFDFNHSVIYINHNILTSLKGNILLVNDIIAA